MRHLSGIFAFFCSILFTLPLRADENIKEVIWHTPNDWDRYVDKQGRGIYVDLVKKIFAPLKIAIRRETFPWKRSLHNVLIGKADFTGGQSPLDTYYMSKYPLAQGSEQIFFRKGTISQPLLDKLKDKRGTWTMGYVAGYPAALKQKIQGNEVSTREQAVRMVLNGRADYYLDNEVQMRDTLKSIDYPSADFDCEELFAAKIYMIFTKNSRGQVIRDIYDKEMARLIRSGELRTIYANWNIPFPDMDERPAVKPRASSCLKRS